LPTLTLDQLVPLLTRYVTETGETLDLLLIGALALPAYGIAGRATHDVDAEVAGPIGSLLDFLTRAQVPADLTQNFSGWSIVAMPPGYRDRSMMLVDRPDLRIRVLTPLDFVLAKLPMWIWKTPCLSPNSTGSALRTFVSPHNQLSQPLPRIQPFFYSARSLNCFARIYLQPRGNSSTSKTKSKPFDRTV
jgi:hypothetical protein